MILHVQAAGIRSTNSRFVEYAPARTRSIELCRLRARDGRLDRPSCMHVLIRIYESKKACKKLNKTYVRVLTCKLLNFDFDSCLVSV